MKDIHVLKDNDNSIPEKVMYEIKKYFYEGTENYQLDVLEHSKSKFTTEKDNYLHELYLKHYNPKSMSLGFIFLISWLEFGDRKSVCITVQKLSIFKLKKVLSLVG